MSLYDDIIKKKKKDWQCEALMDAARADRGDKIAVVDWVDHELSQML